MKNQYIIMRRLTRKPILIIFLVVLSFVLGCIFTSSIMPLDKTCQVQNTNGENILENSKFNNPELIILILSAPENLDKRNIIRDTWLRLLDLEDNNGHNHFQFKHYFIVGEYGLSVRQFNNLKTEQSEFKDILILPIYDSYKNLSEKVKGSFQWLSKQYDNGLGFKYVLKCDDDSFVSLRELIFELMDIDKTISTSGSIANIQDGRRNYVSFNIQRNDEANISHLNLYWGYFSGNAKIKTKGKWKEINWIASDYYLPYALGGGYLLSKDLVTFIGKTGDNLRSFNSEDVSVGIWLAPIDNIVRIHDVRFDTEWISRGCKNTHLITHNVSPIEMKRLFNNLITLGKMCSAEITKRKHYIYDWNVPNSQCCRVSSGKTVIKLPDRR